MFWSKRKESPLLAEEPPIVVAIVLGTAVIDAVRVAVASEQAPDPETVYVISELPAATAVTTPVELLIVATLTSALDHVPPESPSVSKSDVLPEHTASVPLSVPASGAVVTVAVLVAVASEHPPVPVTVYVMSELPAATAVTTPVELLIVATLTSALDQVPPESPSVSKSDVLPEHTASVPLRVPATGAVVTFTVAVAVDEQPVSSFVAVMVIVLVELSASLVAEAPVVIVVKLPSIDHA
jgi:hypothetical protein